MLVEMPASIQNISNARPTVLDVIDERLTRSSGNRYMIYTLQRKVRLFGGREVPT